MQKILITGCNGFLGQHLTLFLTQKNYAVIGVGRNNCRIKNTSANFIYESLDLANDTAIQQCLQKHQPNVIIHAAAMSKPNDCNNNKELCLLNNVHATENLVKFSKPLNLHFIFISTDFIFGENGPHSEDDEPAPLNFYGESKLQAEKTVKNSQLFYSIVRPVFIYGKQLNEQQPTFLHWVKNNLQQNKPIKVVNDQLRTPTYVVDICKGIETIIAKKAQGDFHLAGKDILSPYQMSITVAEVLGLNKNLIEEVTSETFPEPVKRAKKSGLKIDKAIRELNYNPVSFNEGVELSFAKE